MFALPGIIALLVFLYARPQESFDLLQRVPFLYLFLAAALFGYAVDLRLRVTKPRLAPQLWLVVLFAVWAIITVLVKAPDTAVENIMTIAIPIVAFVVVSQSIQTFKAFELLAKTLLGLSLFLCIVGIHQGQADLGCVIVDPKGVGDVQVGQADGRSCSNRDECYDVGGDPGREYLCERIGLFGTNSVAGGRVRYRGILQDPNELALTICITLPFAFAFAARRRRPGTRALLYLSVAAIFLCTLMTKSRTGQLVFLSAVGIFVVKRYGWRGIAVGMILAAPLLLFGGRGGAEASESTLGRLEAWDTGIDLFRVSPLFGVGLGQFTEYHYLTAHNSYILCLAELGFIGLYLWTAIVYMSIKIAVVGYFRYAKRPGAEVARDWGLALIASFAGLLVGVFFLSFSYHAVLWIYVGLAGAYYSAARTHDPKWRVKFGFVDWLLVAGLCLALIAALIVYLKLKPL